MDLPYLYLIWRQYVDLELWYSHSRLHYVITFGITCHIVHLKFTIISIYVLFPLIIQKLHMENLWSGGKLADAL